MLIISLRIAYADADAAAADMPLTPPLIFR